MTRSRVKNDFSVGIDDGADANAITISSSEYVGIGTTNAPIVPLDVVAKTGAHAITMRARSNNDYAFFSMRSNDGTEDLGDIAIQRTAADTGRMLFYTNNGTNATVKMSVLPSGGITFNGDTAAANALDDYEEGTWTPTITSGINSISYNVQAAHYTKIGNIVNTDFYINASGTGSGAQFVVSGLPYAAKNVNYVRGGGCSTYQNFTSNTVQFYGNQGSSFFYCYVDGSTTLTTSGTIGGKYLIGTFSYLSA